MLATVMAREVNAHNCSTTPPPPPPPHSYAPGYIQHNHKDLQAATLICWCHVHVGSRVPREPWHHVHTLKVQYCRTTLQIRSHHLPHACYAKVMLPFTLLIVMLNVHVHNIHVYVIVYTLPATAECCSHATISYSATFIHSRKTSNVK